MRDEIVTKLELLTTSQQLFLRGCLQLQHSGLAALDFFEAVDDLYGVDAEEIPMDVEVSNPDSVMIPFPSISMPEIVSRLRERINPTDRIFAQSVAFMMLSCH